jgi:glucose-6-phosphate 1-dehydrogenase
MDLKIDLKTNGACEVLRAGPCGVVIFGASGHLAYKKLFPSFFKLYKSGSLPSYFFIAGAGRKKMNNDGFRVSVRKAVMEAGLKADEEDLNEFCARFYYFELEYGDREAYTALKAGLDLLAQKNKTGGNTVFMMAVPPLLHGPVTEGIGKSGLAGEEKDKGSFLRVMVEKPFGRDTESAVLLNESLLKYLCESQIYRVDHYLGKNTVQNILVFRFANIVFSPVWNADNIDSVQINFAEDSGLRGRTGYFEQAGLIRDMLQNHIFQLLTLVAMEKPADITAGAVQDEKVKVLRAVRPFDPDRLGDAMIRGQYTAGAAGGKKVPAYRDEEGADENSCVETFFAAKLFIDNERWKGVPFYIRAGKRLNRSATSIHVIFKDVPGSLFTAGGAVQAKNMLSFEIYPEQGVTLKFNAKVPGSKMCIGPLDMEFNYNKIFGAYTGGDYENIILDCMLGDQTLFWRKDAVEESWKILTPVLRRWESCSINEKSKMMFFYEAGSRGPAEADEFIKRDGRAWVE